MKAEVGYQDIVMGAFIEDLIDSIKLNMKSVRINDPYFQQLSVEKFTLETLLREIEEQPDTSPTIVVARFTSRMAHSVNQSNDPDCTFSISRDAAQSILDGLYFDD